MYLIFILTILDPVKTYVAALPEQMPVFFQLKCVCPCIWNNLPTNIRKISTIALFKKTIRSCIKEQNYTTL